jgi:formylglycine-generating enzyme
MRALGGALGAIAVCGVACARAPNALGDAGTDKAIVRVSSATAPGAPRNGMQWIPSGVLRAGSALTEVPRVAETELPGIDTAMGGFYIDALPWPNEAGAIPTTNVTRDDAQRLCATKGKRLCTELEWERACKGPDNTRYEYGLSYDERVCGPPSPVRRPSGESVPCRSPFGVREMHGGPSEWTDARWGRGTTRDLGVVRGGTDPAGEIASRCAYARSLAPAERSPSTGFRCCAGPRNEPDVHLDVKTGAVLERTSHEERGSPPLDALGGTECGPPQSPAPCATSRAWIWRPEANVELSLAGGCIGRWPNARCAVAVSRTIGDRGETLAQVDTGQGAPDIVFVGAADRRVRVVGKDEHRRFVRDIVFTYGRVDVRDVK